MTFYVIDIPIKAEANQQIRLGITYNCFSKGRRKSVMSKKACISLVAVFCCLLVSSSAMADWMQMDPPADVDKKAHGHSGTPSKPTCWLAAASNMLARAGYGPGTTVQARADNIYNQMTAHYGVSSPGWTDVAISWWLSSANNTQKTTNSYTVATVYGHKTKTPYLHDPNWTGMFLRSDDLSEFIGNCLRDELSVGVSINFGFSGGGHAITAWGDSNDSNTLTSNPAKLIVTDSDKDFGGDTQTYTYTLGTTAWYLNYNGTPFIKHIVALHPIDDPNDPNYNGITQNVTSSYKVYNNHRTCIDCNAIGVNYKICSNLSILSYRTSLDWQTSNPLNIQEDPCTPRKYVSVSCDFSDNPVPIGNSFTIDNELVLPYDANWPASMTNTNIVLNYPASPDLIKPGFGCLIGNFAIFNIDANDPNITGGYVIASFDIFEDQMGGTPNITGQGRVCWEYKYFQDPENHEFTLTSLESAEPIWIGNFQFGHSYGILTGDDLWSFDNWLSDAYMSPPYESFDAGSQINLQVDLPGTLPYPRGEDYDPPPTPAKCGEAGTVYLDSDINRDCKVDLRDFAEFTQSWLQCTDPEDGNCIPYE